jgi:hypothetical protein
LEPADVKWLKTLSAANAKPEKLLAERDLEIEVMKEINRKNGKRSACGGTLACNCHGAHRGGALPLPAPGRCRLGLPITSELTTSSNEPMVSTNC